MIRMFIACLSLVIGMGVAPPVSASDLGPALGTRAPHSLELPDASGATRSFAALKGERGLALFFVRSVDWCPYCKTQALDVDARLTEFTERGFGVAFVSYDPVAKQRAFAAKTGFRPALLSDTGIAAINAFGLRNETYAQGSRFYGIPHPAVFILDHDGVIRAKLFEADYATNDKSFRNRPLIDVILSDIDAAMGQNTPN